MERFWNIVHYFVYRGDYKLTLLFNKINPFILLFKLPIIKRNFEKLEVDPMDALNEAHKRPDIGLSSIIAGGVMGGLVFFLCLALVNIFFGVSRVAMNPKLYQFMIMVGISLVVNYFLLFKQDKYLTYFEEFEKMSQADKKKWGWISLEVVIGIVLFLIGSFFILLEGQGRQ